MPKTKTFSSDYIEIGMRLNPQTHKRLKIYAATNELHLITCFDQAISNYLKFIDFELLLQYRLEEISNNQIARLADRRTFEPGKNVKMLILPKNLGKFLLVADLKGITISSLLNLIIIEYLENIKL